MRGDRGGPTLGRLLEGVSRERARCLSGVRLTGDSRERIALLWTTRGLRGLDESPNFPGQELSKVPRKKRDVTDAGKAAGGPRFESV